MAFIPNLRRRKPVIAAGETAPAQQPTFGYIDTLFDYGAFLAASPALAQLSLFAVPALAMSLIFKDIDLKCLHYRA
jgi:hypothetical protein